MKVHRSLDVWKKAIDFAVRVYRVTDQFPRSEEYGLKSQLRRAAVSIPSNIAEGAARQTRKEFVQFLYMAAGSASEVDTQLELAFRLGYIGEEKDISEQLESISRMIFGLIRSPKTRTLGIAS